MSQSIFAEKDIKQVSEALLQERKRLKELIYENEALCAQGQQLRAMLKLAGGESAKTLRAQFQEIEDLKKILEREKKQSSIYKSNNDILSGLIKDKEKRIHELEQFEYSARLAVSEKKEIDTVLGGEVLRSRTLEKEIKETKETLESLQKANAEFAELLESAHAKYKESEKDIEKIQKDLEQEKGYCEELKEKLNEAYAKEKDYIAQAEGHQQDIASLQHKLESETIAKEHSETKQKATITNLYNDHLNLKQTVIIAMREANDLKVRYLEAVKEKSAALGQSQRVSKEIEKHSQDAQEAKKKLNELAETYANRHKKALEEFKEQRGHLLITIDQAQNELQNAIKEKESQKKELDFFEQEVSNLTGANELLKTSNEKITTELQERINASADNEDQLIAAKQHVAKKVKEVALLHEKIDQLSEELALQDEVHKELCEKYKELQDALEEQQQNENEHKEKLNELAMEKIALAEKLAEKADESKIFEMQLKKLKDIEMRHSELQKLLGGLGKVLSPALTSIQPQELPQKLETPRELNEAHEETSLIEKEEKFAHMHENKEEKESKSIDSFSLFDMPKSEGHKSKSSLF